MNEVWGDNNLKEGIKKIADGVIEIIFNRDIPKINISNIITIIILFLIIVIVLNQFYRYFVYKFIVKKLKFFYKNDKLYNEIAEINLNKVFENSNNINKAISKNYLYPKIRKSLFSNSEYECDVELLKIKDGEVILEVSNSTGEFVSYLNSKYPNSKIISLVKTDEDYLLLNNKFNSIKNINIIKCDINNLENNKVLNDKRFDKIILLNEIGNIEYKTKIFKMFNKLLNTGGEIYIKTVTFSDKRSSRLKDVANFWQYNFSTQYNICSSLGETDYNSIRYSDIDLLHLYFASVPQDFILLIVFLVLNYKYLLSSKMPLLKIILTHLYILCNGLRFTIIIATKK